MAQHNPTQTRFAQATIIGDSDASSHALQLAGRVGSMLAIHSITVVTGGGGGVMEAAARGAFEQGGRTVGIVPSTQMDDANPWCTVVIPTGLGHARNVMTALAADMIVAIGGGAGTLSEVCFAWMHGRPVYLMEESGGWSDRLGVEPLDHRGTSRIVRCRDIAVLQSHIVGFCQSRGLRFRPS